MKKESENSAGVGRRQRQRQRRAFMDRKTLICHVWPFPPEHAFVYKWKHPLLWQNLTPLCFREMKRDPEVFLLSLNNRRTRPLGLHATQTGCWCTGGRRVYIWRTWTQLPSDLSHTHPVKAELAVIIVQVELIRCPPADLESALSFKSSQYWWSFTGKQCCISQTMEVNGDQFSNVRKTTENNKNHFWVNDHIKRQAQWRAYLPALQFFHGHLRGPSCFVASPRKLSGIFMALKLSHD